MGKDKIERKRKSKQACKSELKNKTNEKKKKPIEKQNKTKKNLYRIGADKTTTTTRRDIYLYTNE